METRLGFDTTLSALLQCKEIVLFLRYLVFLSISSIRKGKKFVSKQGQPQPHIHSMARILRTLLYNGLMYEGRTN